MEASCTWQAVSRRTGVLAWEQKSWQAVRPTGTRIRVASSLWLRNGQRDFHRPTSARGDRKHPTSLRPVASVDTARPSPDVSGLAHDLDGCFSDRATGSSDQARELAFVDTDSGSRFRYLCHSRHAYIGRDFAEALIRKPARVCEVAQVVAGRNPASRCMVPEGGSSAVQTSCEPGHSTCG